MILDTLAQSAQYDALNPRFARAFAFLRQLPADAKVGRHEIDGDDCFALVQQYTTKPVAERQFEAHRQYIDIQFVARGREYIYWAPLSTLTNVTMPFDTSKDAALYSGAPEKAPIEVREGQFAILFPQDGHAPACAWGDPAEVRKVVVKVRV